MLRKTCMNCKWNCWDTPHPGSRALGCYYGYELRTWLNEEDAKAFAICEELSPSLKDAYGCRWEASGSLDFYGEEEKKMRELTIHAFGGEYRVLEAPYIRIKMYCGSCGKWVIPDALSFGKTSIYGMHCGVMHDLGYISFQEHSRRPANGRKRRILKGETLSRKAG